MRTTIDIPDDTFRALKIRAASEGTTIRKIILDALEERPEPAKAPHAKGILPFPVIQSKRPGTLDLTNEQIDELTAFT